MKVKNGGRVSSEVAALKFFVWKFPLAGPETARDWHDLKGGRSYWPTRWVKKLKVRFLDFAKGSADRVGVPMGICERGGREVSTPP